MKPCQNRKKKPPSKKSKTTLEKKISSTQKQDFHYPRHNSAFEISFDVFEKLSRERKKETLYSVRSG